MRDILGASQPLLSRLGRRQCIFGHMNALRVTCHWVLSGLAETLANFLDCITC